MRAREAARVPSAAAVRHKPSVAVSSLRAVDSPSYPYQTPCSTFGRTSTAALYCRAASAEFTLIQITHDGRFCDRATGTVPPLLSFALTAQAVTPDSWPPRGDDGRERL